MSTLRRKTKTAGAETPAVFAIAAEAYFRLCNGT